MKIVVPPMTVTEDDGFKNDALNRQLAQVPIALLKHRHSIEGRVGPVPSTDSGGEGKTTFVKMWRGLLAEQNIPSIYIDAFRQRLFR